MNRNKFCELFVPGYGPLVNILRTRSLNPTDWSSYTKANLAFSLMGLTKCSPEQKLQEPKEEPKEEPKVASQEFVSPELMALGQELSSWQSRDNKYMVEMFPQVRQAAELLQGNRNPQEFNPFLQLPLGFSISQETTAGFVIIVNYSYWKDYNQEREQKEHILFHFPSGESFKLSFPTINGFFTLSPEIRQSDVRLPMIVKEVSQLIDSPGYCRLFTELLKKSGYSYELVNPANILLTEFEIYSAVAYTIAAAGWDKDFFRNLIDLGSVIRTGDVFASWYQDQLSFCGGDISNCPQLQNETVRSGMAYLGYLQEKDFMRQEEGRFVWTNGGPPDIMSPEFIEIVNTVLRSQ